MMTTLSCTVIVLLLALSTSSYAQNDPSSCDGDADIYLVLDTTAPPLTVQFDTLKAFALNLGKDLTTFSSHVGVTIFDESAELLLLLKDANNATLESSFDEIQPFSWEESGNALADALELLSDVGFSSAAGHNDRAEKIVIIITHSASSEINRVRKAAEALQLVDTRIVTFSIGDKNGDLFHSFSHYVELKNFKELLENFANLKYHVCHNQDLPVQEVLKVQAQKHKKAANKTTVENPRPCTGICPEKYHLDPKTCNCQLIQSTDPMQCSGILCAEDYAPDVDCECEKFICSSLQTCDKKCDDPFVLDEEACACRCNSTCDGDWGLDEINCKCICEIQCLASAIVDEEQCKCISNPCKEGEEWQNGRCVEGIKKYCSEGQLLIQDVCVNTNECPPGYHLVLEARQCLQQCCRTPYADNSEPCRPESCGENKYWINGVCTVVQETACQEHAFFDFNKPPCARTCAEPVQLSLCENPMVGPGCSCRESFLLHNGQCIHPDDCPNKPLCVKNADILILLDGSSTIGERNFALMTTFVQDVIQLIDVETGSNRLAVLQFHHYIFPILNMDSYRQYNKAEMLKIMANVHYKLGLKYLGEALHHVQTEHVFDSQGVRKNVTRILILLTDGQETHGPIDPYHEARLLREAGVQLVVVKVGEPNDEDQERIKQLAGVSGRMFLFGLRHFHEVNMVLSRMMDLECDEIVCPRPRLITKPCEGEYQYIDKEEFYPVDHKCELKLIENATKRRCSCPEGTKTVSACEDDYQNVTYVNYEFDAKQTLCNEKKSVEKVRCACPGVSISRTDCFNEFQSIITTSYVLEDSVNSGKYCRAVNDTLTERCGCPPPIVTSEKCIGGFKVMKTQSFEFDSINKTCIKTFNDQEVRCSCPDPEVVTKPCNNHEVEVKVIVQKITEEELCDVTTYIGHEHCNQVCEDVIDIGLIVDTSSSISPTDFEVIKQFLIELVGSFNLGEEFTRATLMTFSSENEIRLISDFFTFFHKEAFQQRIGDMKFYPGSTNTGEALRVYRTEALTPPHGSRIHQNVRQLVYLLTDGIANGEVNPIEEAKKLKTLGVQIVVIAVGKQLVTDVANQIASSPSELNMFEVKEFSELSDNLQLIGDRRCSMENDVDQVSVRNKYQTLIQNLRNLNPDSAIESLPGDEFAHLQVLDQSDFCRVIFSMKGYLSVLAGSELNDQANFENTLKTKLANTMKVLHYEIQSLQLTANNEERTSSVTFDGPCEGVEKFVSDLYSDKFDLLDKNDKNIEFHEDVVVISPYTRKIVERTDIADAHASEIADIVKGVISDSELEENLTNIVKTNQERRVKLHKLLSISEEEAVALAEKIQNDDDLLILSSIDSIRNIRDASVKANIESKVGDLKSLFDKEVDATSLLVEESENFVKKFKAVAGKKSSTADTTTETTPVDM